MMEYEDAWFTSNEPHILDERLEAAELQATPVAVIARLAIDADINVRRAVAANPATPADILAMQVDDPHVCKQIADNTAATAEILGMLVHPAREPSETTCFRVAGHANTDAYTLDQLSSHPCMYVRSEVVQNPNVSDTTLTRLAEDKSPYVKYHAAACVNDPRALAMLAKSINEPIRVNVARNKNSSVATLSALALDESHRVRKAVFTNVNY